ncbi:MAG: protein kinase [Bacillota bacterium]|nr:protein kinase [Bacillota bacterium]
MKSNLYELYIKNFEINLLNCKVLGKGHNGIVYMLPEGKVIKICFESKSCYKEYFILNKVNNNKYFPRVYGMMGNYMIRDYVDGITFKDYVKDHGLNRELALKLICLLEEFYTLNFKKIDIRCKDIIIKPNGKLMIIDPKKFFSKERDFPRHLSKGLYNLGVLNYFMSVLKEERPNLYKKWNERIIEYVYTCLQDCT